MPRPARWLLIVVILLALNIIVWGSVVAPQRPEEGSIGVEQERIVALSSPTQAAPAATARLAEMTATPAAPPATATAAPLVVPTQPVTPSALTSLDQITAAVHEGRGGVSFRLSLSEQQLTQEITLYLSQNPDLAFSDIAVALRPGEAILTGKARILGFTVGFTARTTVVLINSRPRLRVLSLDTLGGLLPGMIKDRLIQIIEESADLPLLDDLPVVIEQIIIEHGEVIVIGRLI